MITGHRPSKLGGYCNDNPIAKKVKSDIKNILINANDSVSITGITGMAIGADQYFAEVCFELDIPYIAYVPFPNQEKMWPNPVKSKYYDLLSQSLDIVQVSDGNFTPKKMQLRNIAMSNDADMAIAVWNKKKAGGTYNCISYLRQQKEVPIIFIEV